MPSNTLIDTGNNVVLTRGKGGARGGEEGKRGINGDRKILDFGW